MRSKSNWFYFMAFSIILQSVLSKSRYDQLKKLRWPFILPPVVHLAAFIIGVILGFFILSLFPS